MKFGLNDNIIFLIEKVFESNSKIDKVIIFGSRAKGNFKPGSDIDLAVKGRDVNFDDILSLSSKLDDLNLPYEIDLINYSTIKDEDVIEHIDRVGIVFYERWKKYGLEEITEPIKNTFIPGGTNDYKYIGLEHIDAKTLKINSVGLSSEVISNKFLFKSNDVLFGKLRPYFRKVVQPKFDGVCSTDIWVFRAKEKVDQNFLFYFLANWNFVNTADGGEGGTKMPRADWNFLKTTEWYLPPLIEQQTIASILKCIDDKINLLQRQNKTLEQLAETLFRQWFMEEASEDWEFGKLGDVLDLVYGKALKEEVRAGSGFPVIGSSGVVGYHTKSLVKSPGVVIGRKGTLGKVIYLFENFFPIDTTYFVKTKGDSVGLFYEYFLLKTLNFEELNSDSAVPGLNRDMALSTEIAIAPIEKISEYNIHSNSLFEKIKINSNQVQTLTKMRDGLLPKLMSGEVRVSL